MKHVVVLAVLTCLTQSALAQEYPVKPIRLIVAFPPGGPRDTQARLIGPKLTQAWGQPVVIDNRAGANGVIGTEIAARSPPDGYTLTIITAGEAAAVTLQSKMPYDLLRDFAMVAPLTAGPGMLVVNNALPAKTLKEFLAYARARPGQLNYGSAGTGAPSHLSVELLNVMAQIQLTHVPYKGMAPALTDVIGGQIQLSLPTIPGGLPHAQAGRVRSLAVSSAKRSQAAPDVPTMTEAGVPGYEATNWYGIAVPAGTPRAIVQKINHEIGRIVAAPDVRGKLLAMGMEPESSTPEVFAAHVKREVAKWAQVIRAAKLQ